MNILDFSRLPRPAVIEALDYEAIRAELIADLQERLPEWDALVESDPAVKLLEVAAYRELILRQRVNDAANALLLAYAVGADLDQLAGNVAIERLEGESDTAIRARAQQAFWALAAAGPAATYAAHARAASHLVEDANVYQSGPGHVVVAVLGRQPKPVDVTDTEQAYAIACWGAGATDIIARNGSELIRSLSPVLNAEHVRPLTDMLSITAPSIIPVEVEVDLTLYPGPAADLVLAESIAAMDAHIAAMRRIGYDLTRAGITEAAFVPGVQDLEVRFYRVTRIIGDDRERQRDWSDFIPVSPGQMALVMARVITVREARNV